MPMIGITAHPHMINTWWHFISYTSDGVCYYCWPRLLGPNYNFQNYLCIDRKYSFIWLCVYKVSFWPPLRFCFHSPLRVCLPHTSCHCGEVPSWLGSFSMSHLAAARDLVQPSEWLRVVLGWITTNWIIRYSSIVLLFWTFLMYYFLLVKPPFKSAAFRRMWHGTSGIYLQYFIFTTTFNILPYSKIK